MKYNIGDIVIAFCLDKKRIVSILEVEDTGFGNDPIYHIREYVPHNFFPYNYFVVYESDIISYTTDEDLIYGI